MPGSVDLVFADPPYRKAPGDRDFASELLASTDLRSIISRDGMLVLESGAGGAKDVGPLWVERERRSYGGTVLTFLEPSPS